MRVPRLLGRGRAEPESMGQEAPWRRTGTSEGWPLPFLFDSHLQSLARPTLALVFSAFDGKSRLLVDLSGCCAGFVSVTKM